MLNPVNHTAKPSTGYLLCGGGNEDHLPGIYNRQTSRFQQTFNEIKVSAKEQQSKTVAFQFKHIHLPFICVVLAHIQLLS